MKDNVASIENVQANGNLVFSIIVVSLNAQDSIAATISSVLNQTFKNYEIVVKDGLSTDDTLSKIPKNGRIRVCSQNDDGIYDAMNQGISMASGKYLIFMNCGDTFFDSTVLQTVNEYLNEQSQIVYGDYVRNSIERIQPNQIYPFYLFRTPLGHQTMFIKRELFNEFGSYNVDNKILSDYEFTLKCFFAGVKFEHIPCVINNYLGGGVSELQKNKRIKKEEYKRIRKTYFGSKYYPYKIKHELTFPGIRRLLVSDKAPRFVAKLYSKIVKGVNKN